MGIVLLSLVFAILTLLTVSLQKTYQYVPQKELKRRSREGDEFAKLLYRAVGYGYSLEVVLWGLIGLSAAGFFLITARVWPAWFALIASAILIWLGFFWVPTGRITKLGMRLAAWLAPALSWLLNYLHPVLDRLVTFVKKRRPVHFHTGLYTKEDLLELLELQQVQADSRIEQSELDVARNALTFGDKIVRDILTPRRVVKTVNVEESVGPVLMTELHESGFSRFPVFEGENDNIIGTLYLRDITRAKTGGKVRGLVRPNDVCYVHEEQPLTEVLQAILKTRRHLMIVVNGFEEYVGVITIEDVLEQILGKPIMDEFDQYEDMRAVAAKMAAKDHKGHQDHSKVIEDEIVVE
jgi:CBS domain containing-hemolysin-like protein